MKSTLSFQFDADKYWNNGARNAKFGTERKHLNVKFFMKFYSQHNSSKYCDGRNPLDFVLQY
jgi:hypothetical protein